MISQSEKISNSKAVVTGLYDDETAEPELDDDM